MIQTNVENTNQGKQDSIRSPRIAPKTAAPSDPEMSEAWYALFLAGLLIGIMVLGGYWIWWNAVYGV